MLRSEPNGFLRKHAAFYKLTHVLSDQGSPRSEHDWITTLRAAGWNPTVHRGDARLVLYECT
jgi:hypothetical protein